MILSDDQKITNYLRVPFHDAENSAMSNKHKKVKKRDLGNILHQSEFDSLPLQHPLANFYSICDVLGSSRNSFLAAATLAIYCAILDGRCPSILILLFLIVVLALVSASRDPQAGFAIVKRSILT